MFTSKALNDIKEPINDTAESTAKAAEKLDNLERIAGKLDTIADRLGQVLDVVRLSHITAISADESDRLAVWQASQQLIQEKEKKPEPPHPLGSTGKTSDGREFIVMTNGRPYGLRESDEWAEVK